MSDDPASVQSVDIDELRVAYRRAGTGPPLVLLHGAVSDSRVWRPQIESLSDEFDVIAWDAPGAGASDDPRPPFGFGEWADTLAGLLAALDVGPANVLGLSFGSTLALELYRRHGEAVSSLVLAGGYAGWRGSLPADECETRREMALRTSQMSGDELAEQWLPSLVSDGAPPEIVDELRVMIAESHPAGLRLMAEAMAEADLNDVLPAIDVPTLLLWGEDDARSPPSVAERMRATIPDARLVLIADAGHECNVEQPALFNAAVREFCQGVR